MKAFNEISSYDFEEQCIRQIKSEIQEKEKDQILRIDEQDFITYLESKYLLSPLQLAANPETVGQPLISKENVSRGYYGREVNEQLESYTFTVKYRFEGSPELFRVRSNPWHMESYDIKVDEQNQVVSYSFTIYKQEADEFFKEKNKCYSQAFSNLPNINGNVHGINQKISTAIRNLFQNEKDKYLKQNDFFAAINIQVNPDTKSVFTAPTIKKRIIPQPTFNKTKEFSSEPMMSTEMYNDVLKVIYDSGKSMEKKPALYKNKDEEGLRDQFLFVLETRYEGTTASGETFNRAGKTDILLKYAKDASNLFVAECKFWHGASEFLEAISQLFDRYLTRRDSKAALLMFVKNKDFTSVLSKIKLEIQNHPCYKAEAGARGETSFSYVFSLPQDKDKIVHFEILAFHYDK